MIPDHQKQHKSDRDNKNYLSQLSDVYRNLAPYLNIGYVWAASVLIFTLIGWYLDKHLQTHPWFTVCGAIIGIVTGFYHFFKTVSGLQNQSDSKNVK